jgi:hypothetical protein
MVAGALIRRSIVATGGRGPTHGRKHQDHERCTTDQSGTLVADPERRTGRTASRRRARLIGVLAALAKTAGPAHLYGRARRRSHIVRTLVQLHRGRFQRLHYDQLRRRRPVERRSRARRLHVRGAGRQDHRARQFDVRGRCWRAQRPFPRLRPARRRFSPSAATNPEGLFADFYGTNIDLNEFSGQDKVFAEITYFDIDSNTWITHRTGEVVGSL